MAHDLSVLLKDTIVSTLNLNLGKETSIKDVYVPSKKEIKDLNLILIDTKFTFENLDSDIKFLFPAITASLIYNTLMMEDGDPILEVNDDIADGVKEITAQVTGSLETSINALDIEEFGTCKLTCGDFTLIDKNEYETSEDTILLKIKIEEKLYMLFMQFDDNNKQFFEEVLISVPNEEEIDLEEVGNILDEDNSLSNETDIEDRENGEHNVSLKNDAINKDDTNVQNMEEVENTTVQLLSEESEEENSEVIDGNIPNQDNKQKNTQDTQNNDEEQLSDEDRKNKKLKKIIIGLGSFLLFMIITFITMAFMGLFDPPPPPPPKAIKVKKSSDDIIVPNVLNKEIDFKIEMINKKRLNNRLSYLTKYEILDVDVVKKYKEKEKERLYNLKMQRLENFAAENKEESLFNKSLVNSDIINEDRFLDKNSPEYKLAMIKKETLSFIIVSPLKYKKYKNIIDNEKRKSTRISICKDKASKTQVYIGPIYLNLVVNNLMSKLSPKEINKNDINISLMSQEDFDLLCNF
jgi:chemotaxis protein CheY-P-specific phosphatase CheC